MTSVLVGDDFSDGSQTICSDGQRVDFTGQTERLGRQALTRVADFQIRCP
jgi:hypothetical protein